MNLIQRVLIVAGFACATSAAIAADWPQWGGPNRDNISKETGLLKSWPDGGPKLLWTFDAAGAGYSGPAIVGDRLYILGCDDPEKGDNEFALCVSVKDGKEIWRQKLETSPGKYTTGYGAGPRCTPTIDGDFLYVLGARGDLQCRKISDGSKVWGLNLVKDFGGKIPGWGYCESVLIDGDHLLCTPGGAKGSIACLNKKTGDVVWRSTDLTDGAAYSSLVINNFGVKHYVTLLPAGVVGVRASDGKLLWRSAAGKNFIAVIPTAILHDKYVFATSGYGSGCGLVELTPDGKDGLKAKDVYLLKVMQNHHGGVILIDDYIYGYSDKGGWMCLDYLKLEKDVEEPVWKNNKLEKGSLSFASGHFYCYGQKKGECVLVEANPKEWKESGHFEIPQKTKFPRKSGGIWTHPVIANGKLFLRDNELIFCYEVKGLD